MSTARPHPVIAIDGPAASGKSTVARLLADRLGFSFVGSGTLYRALAWGLIQTGIDPADEAAVATAFGTLDFACGLERGRSWVAINGRRLGTELEEPATNAAVSPASRVPALRDLVVDRLRAFRLDCPLVMEGRDIASVVFPDTPWKYYIDASPEVRQRRRAAQGQTDSVSDRDRADRSRASAPLVVVDGAVVIDSSEIAPDGVVEAILADLAAHQAAFLPAMPN
jgi:CMP/dCMP kinase